jgi:hypothetical protein
MSKKNKSFENNENKNYINANFMTEVVNSKLENNCYENNYFVGVLDSIENNTSNTLISNGIKKENILLVESNKEIAKLHIEKKFKTYFGTLKEFGNDNTNETFLKNNKCLGWYFDTCGTISTQNKGVFNSIKKSNLINGTILGFTFCRSRMSCSKYITHKHLFMNDLNVLTNTKGLMCVDIFNRDYSGKFIFKRSRNSHMNSFFVKCIKYIKYL